MANNLCNSMDWGLQQEKTTNEIQSVAAGTPVARRTYVFLVWTYWMCPLGWCYLHHFDWFQSWVSIAGPTIVSYHSQLSTGLRTWNYRPWVATTARTIHEHSSAFTNKDGKLWSPGGWLWWKLTGIWHDQTKALQPSPQVWISKTSVAGWTKWGVNQPKQIQANKTPIKHRMNKTINLSRKINDLTKNKTRFNN